MRRRAHPAADAALNLAASWYVAMPSRELGRSPKPVTLFGRPMVVWRDGSGRVTVMPRACPHMGASLAQGRVVGGALQCPFHHWRFDAGGTCVAVPGADRIPVRAHRLVYPAVERYGYIWVWYGSAEPMFPLPHLPALDPAGRGHRRFRFADTTGATVRRIMENTYDPDHLVELHGLQVAGPLRLRLLTPADFPAEHGPAIPAEAWFGAELGWPRYSGRLGALTRLMGTNAAQFVLRVDGWPAGQRITYYADGVPQYRLLLAATPVAANRTVQHIAVAVERSGRYWRDLWHYLVNRIEVTVASNQDLPIFDTIRPGDHHGIYVEGDHGVRRFRRYYQEWVDRAAPATTHEPAHA
ncbi:Rieske 2Fe-2S domain-containing protein [Dactylosporangium sp. NPDC050688]|uniref:Rieske 2Fe-2S domain-containing protein n=1 Tax=Dactylosporangium sp. NPDC050688 TaxID=3157217 RepID=UPI0033C674C9